MVGGGLGLTAAKAGVLAEGGRRVEKEPEGGESRTPGGIPGLRGSENGGEGLKAAENCRLCPREA